jgi:hypothetical protein
MRRRPAWTSPRTSAREAAEAYPIGIRGGGAEEAGVVPRADRPQVDHLARPLGPGPPHRRSGPVRRRGPERSESVPTTPAPIATGPSPSAPSSTSSHRCHRAPGRRAIPGTGRGHAGAHGGSRAHPAPCSTGRSASLGAPGPLRRGRRAVGPLGVVGPTTTWIEVGTGVTTSHGAIASGCGGVVALTAGAGTERMPGPRP